MVIMEYASKTREGAFDHETAHVKSGKHHWSRVNRMGSGYSWEKISRKWNDVPYTWKKMNCEKKS